MSRVKYPYKDEINRQIQNILDESGMFEQAEKNQRYTEFVPVKRKPFLRTEIVFPIAAAAVVLLSVISIKKISGILPGVYGSNSSNSDIEAMTNVIADDTIKTANTTKINDNIEVAKLSRTRYLAKQVDGNTQITVEFVYNYPEVYYKGVPVTNISEYYEQRFKEIMEQVWGKYGGMLLEDRNNVEYDAENISKVQYNCSAMGGISTDENNLITIYENYSENVKGYGETIIINATYGSNFDAVTGQRLELSDIFADQAKVLSESGINEIYEVVKNTAKEKLNGITVDIEKVKESGSWYFSSDGLTICINDIKGEDNTRPGMIYRNYYGVSVVIPYSSLPALKAGYIN